VTLEGTTALERAVEVARGVPGVRDVRTQQVEIPPIPPFVA
jgi:osmotically-inducible protein OsmY